MMGERLFIALIGALALAAEAVVLAAILVACHRIYRRDYLRLWSWSWWAMAVGCLAVAASLLLLQKMSAREPARLVLTAVSLGAAFWHAFWLLLGTWEVSGRTPLGPSTQRRALLGLGGAAAILTLLFAFEPAAAAARYLVRVGLKSLVVGGAFLAVGVWVLRAARGSYQLGRRMVGWGFLAFGAQQLAYAASGLVIPRVDVGRLYSAMAFADLVIPLVIGVGMVAWLLEEEHDRVVKATRSLELLALYDSLTDLPNRSLLQDRLSQAVKAAARGDTGMAVATIDLDGFREVNDTYGSRYGDELLRKVAGRLVARIRPGDTLARIGGDEFCAVLTGVSQENAVAAVERLLAGLARPVTVFELELETHASVGVALYPAHGATAAELLANASRALAAAKADKRARILVFDPLRDAARSERVRIESALPRALAAGELILRYQPIVRVMSGEVAAFEALVRWAHPTAGELLPGVFLPAAEASGLDLEVTEWVLRTAVTEFAWLQREGFDQVELAVNLSPRVFQHPAFTTLAAAVLAENSFDPAMLHLEITETAAMHDADVALAAFRELKRLGVRIALDDFGTGYSSLSYLRFFPVDVLKIDQSFVKRLRYGSGDSAVVESIISLARTLRLAVTAEGVEREEQARWLGDHGCDFMQGHLISPALTLDECRAFLRRPVSASQWRTRPLTVAKAEGPVH